MEARVTAVSDELFKYTRLENGALIQTPHTPFELTAWRTKAERLEGHHSKKLGIVTGPVDIIFEVELLRGMRRTEEGATVKEYGKITGMDTEYAAQTVVFEVHEEDQRFVEKEPLPIEEEFPEGTRAFFLGEYSHGSPLEVIDHANGKANVWVSTQVCIQVVSGCSRNFANLHSHKRTFSSLARLLLHPRAFVIIHPFRLQG